MAAWTAEQIPDQTGRVAVVTGANSGIGYETARLLAGAGAHVVLGCRDAKRAKRAMDGIVAEEPAGSVDLQLIDLADLESVERFAQEFESRYESLDLLILNAGVMVPPEGRTKQGFELQFGVNHLGHFALAGRLLRRLLTTRGSRVVVVSSAAANLGRMRFDDLNFENRRYRPWLAYGQSKLANQLFVREFQRRLRAAGADQLVVAAHPGWTATDLQRTSQTARLLNPILAMPPERGALPTLRAATDPNAAPAAYYGPHGPMQMRGYPVRVPFVEAARDDRTARELWEKSEELTQVTYDFESTDT